MRNNFFISLISHILLGVFFTFPVYTFQTVSAEEISEKINSAFSESVDNGDEDGDAVKSPETVKKSQRKTYSQSIISSITAFSRIVLLSEDIKINQSHVDLSFLKEIRITKMLC